MQPKFIFFIALIFSFIFLSGTELYASGSNDTIIVADDTVHQNGKYPKTEVLDPYQWNVLKFNPTPMLLFDELRNVTFSYERLFNKHKSVSLQLGYLVVPQTLDDTLYNTILFEKDKRKGINIAADYRIYPFSRNRRPAPDGLYYGGYLSYIGTTSESKGRLKDTSADEMIMLNARMNMINLGFELGYQFVFARKFTIDLLMFGPSITGYWANFDLTGNLNSDIGDDIDEDLAAILKERYPVLGYLFSDEAETFSTSRIVVSSWFRYSVQFGYHF